MSRMADICICAFTTTASYKLTSLTSTLKKKKKLTSFTVLLGLLFARPNTHLSPGLTGAQTPMFPLTLTMFILADLLMFCEQQ